MELKQSSKIIEFQDDYFQASAVRMVRYWEEDKQCSIYLSWIDEPFTYDNISVDEAAALVSAWKEAL